MKANELMIGDLVTFKDCQNEEEILVIKIWQLNQDGNALVFIDDSKVLDEIAIDDEIVGISLTPEILEKNGFERCVSSIARTSTAVIPICDSNQFCHKNLGNLRIIDKHPCYGWTLRTDVFGDTCHNEIHHINYVHELQHALKLCGITLNIEL